MILPRTMRTPDSPIDRTTTAEPKHPRPLTRLAASRAWIRSALMAFVLVAPANRGCECDPGTTHSGPSAKPAAAASDHGAQPPSALKADLPAKHGSGKEEHMTTNDKKTMTPEQMKAAVARRTKGIRFADIQSEGCVDGRGTRKIIGVPGADQGRQLAMLSAIEQATGKPLSRNAVRAYIGQQAALYMHTDSHAEHAVQHALEHHPTLQKYLAKGVRALYEHGTGNAEDNTLLAVEVRKNLKCGHLAGMMAEAAQFGVRPELIHNLIEETLLRKWSGANVTFEVLEGDHGEQAVGVVRTPDLTDDTVVAALQPSEDGKDQMFVNHPDVTEAMMRRELPALLAVVKQHDDIDADERAVYEAAVKNLARHTDLTVGRLAKGLPVDEVTVDPSHPDRASVKQVAVVPGGK